MFKASIENCQILKHEQVSQLTFINSTFKWKGNCRKKLFSPQPSLRLVLARDTTVDTDCTVTPPSGAVISNNSPTWEGRGPHSHSIPEDAGGVSKVCSQGSLPLSAESYSSPE